MYPELLSAFDFFIKDVIFFVTNKISYSMNHYCVLLSVSVFSQQLQILNLNLLGGGLLHFFYGSAHGAQMEEVLTLK